MSAEGLAVLAAFAYAASNVCIRVGARTTSIVTGLLISLIAGTVLMLAALVVDRPEAIGAAGVAFFAVSGVVGPGMGRVATMIGIQRLGSAAATPLVASLYPVFAVGAAVVALSETLSAQRLAGLSLVAAGVWVISRRDAEPSGSEGVAHLTTFGAVRGLPAVTFPLGAGILYASSDVLRKRATDLLPDAVLGAAIGMACALALWLVTWAASERIRSEVRFDLGAGTWWYAVSGLLSAAALLAVTQALERGDVSVVTPIVAAHPVGVLLLAAVFLRASDRIDAKVVTGTAAVVLGTLAISTG